MFQSLAGRGERHDQKVSINNSSFPCVTQQYYNGGLSNTAQRDPRERMNDQLTPHLPQPPPPPPPMTPSLISHLASVDVNQHVYLLSVKDLLQQWGWDEKTFLFNTFPNSFGMRWKVFVYSWSTQLKSKSTFRCHSPAADCKFSTSTCNMWTSCKQSFDCQLMASWSKTPVESTPACEPA